ncbi:MAG: lysophospholipid acyltransferase family protein [Pelagibacteraceae bacterium]|jgi:1-acyl-sn-glycerol-3-phosphate acyltransferase|nr:1-acyl-sn-glycerol-3-phosphate acyltransferase [Candidatus Pelagibacter sp.]MDP6680255.1 lysophospholipid acyltransferase family protein [Pelagibacteraceae bacterium]MDP6709848.1 lysophospholipid acyltransferase family protein [Pelagibacteraceae bacterium]|tara:strand:+ start:318 stop:1025 length:708 start_codon:yes stop_codon:yes gene_type:complete
MLLLRSLLFNLFLYTGIATVFLIALPTLFLPAKITLLFGKFLGYYVIFIVRIFLNTKVEFKGTENIPKNEKYFVASAHQSMFETFALQSILDYPVFILKKELLKIPLFGLYLKKIKSIEIIRNTTTKDNLNFFDRVANIIKNENRPLLIFPQGTRVMVDDKVPFKKGVGRIYEALNISCVPVALNSGKVWPKNGIIKYPGKITVSFLEPIKPGLNRNDFIKNLEMKIYNEIKNIS